MIKGRFEEWYDRNKERLSMYSRAGALFEAFKAGADAALDDTYSQNEEAMKEEEENVI